jgi:hypothetical protein
VIIYLPGLTEFSGRKAAQATWAFRAKKPLPSVERQPCRILALPFRWSERVRAEPQP